MTIQLIGREYRARIIDYRVAEISLRSLPELDQPRRADVGPDLLPEQWTERETAVHVEADKIVVERDGARCEFSTVPLKRNSKDRAGSPGDFLSAMDRRCQRTLVLSSNWDQHSLSWMQKPKKGVSGVTSYKYIRYFLTLSARSISLSCGEGRRIHRVTGPIRSEVHGPDRQVTFRIEENVWEYMLYAIGNDNLMMLVPIHESVAEVFSGVRDWGYALACRTSDVFQSSMYPNEKSPRADIEVDAKALREAIDTELREAKQKAKQLPADDTTDPAVADVQICDKLEIGGQAVGYTSKYPVPGIKSTINLNYLRDALPPRAKEITLSIARTQAWYICDLYPTAGATLTRDALVMPLSPPEKGE